MTRRFGNRWYLGVRAPGAGGIVATMSQHTPTPSERPYDPAEDPDADPEQLTHEEPVDQPSQAEGEDGPPSSSAS